MIGNSFCSQRRWFLLKPFYQKLDIMGDDMFADDSLINDKQFIKTITKLSYDWKKVSELKTEYCSGIVFAKKSKIKELLDNIEWNY